MAWLSPQIAQLGFGIKKIAGLVRPKLHLARPKRYFLHLFQSCCDPPGGFVSGFLVCGGRCKLVVSGGVTRGRAARGVIWRRHRGA